MRAVILRVVDGGDGLFGKADAHALHVQQHVRLILEALPLNAAEGLEILPRNGAQPRLCVGELYAVAYPEKARCGLVPGDASRRNAGGVEVPAAEHDLIPLAQHTLAAGDDIAHKVLPVAVDGDDALHAGQVFIHVCKGGLETAPLSAVDAVVQHGDVRVRLTRLVEIDLMLAVTPVVHDDYVLEALLLQPVHNAEELLVRIQRGQNDCQ